MLHEEASADYMAE